METDPTNNASTFLSLAVDDSCDEEDQQERPFFRSRSLKRHSDFRKRRRGPRSRKWSCRTSYRYMVWILKASAGFASGFLFALIILPFAHWPVEDHFDDAFRGFDSSIGISPHAPDYPTDYMKSVLPIPCHSHNDYWRQRPLYSALGSGCISIEADVWSIGNDLFVAHTMDEVEEDRTLESLYIKPLIELLDHLNRHSRPEEQHKGVFYQNPLQTLVLVVDLKSSESWGLLQKQIEPLREKGYLTFWDGMDRVERAITIVASGTTPFDMLIANETYRDVFYDAPLHALVGCAEVDCSVDEDIVMDANRTRYNTSNSYYASSSLVHALGPLARFALTQSQMKLMQRQVLQARSVGLVPRYYGTPRWPRGLRDEIWSVLLHEDVGVINVDDLRAVRKGIWGSWPQKPLQNLG